MAPMPAPVPTRVDDPTIAQSLMAGEGSPAANALAPEPSSEYFEPVDRKQGTSWRAVGIGFGVIDAVVVILALATYVVPYSHTASGWVGPQNDGVPFSRSSGTSVTISWQSSNSAPPTTFVVYKVPNSDVIYNPTALSGNVSFTATGGTYFVAAYEGPSSVDPLGASYQITYESPLY
jgi:hypothetical protein